MSIRWPKLFSYGVLLSAVVATVAPLLCGYWLQQRITQDVSALHDSLNNYQLQHIRIEPIHYQRGWFSSEYTMRIGWQGQDQSLILHHKLMHGPLPWTQLKQGNFQPLFVSGLSRLDFSQAQWPFVMPELKFASVVDFAGNIDIDWRFLGYRNEHVEGRLDVASSEGELYFAQSEKRIYGALKVPDLRLALKNTQRWSVSGLAVGFDFSRGDAVLPLGALSIELLSARIQQAKQDFLLTGLKQKIQLSEFDRLSNIQYLLEAESVKTPSLDLKQLRLDSILRGINEAILTALKPEQAPTSLAELILGLEQQVKQRAPVLLSGTEFEIAHFEANLPEGRSEGFLRTQVPELKGVAEMAPRDLLKAVNMSAELSLPQGLLHNILANSGVQDKFQLSKKYLHLKRKLPEEQLNALAQDAASQQLSVVVAQGLVRKNQGTYWSSVELKQGELSFNGHKVHGF